MTTGKLTESKRQARGREEGRMITRVADAKSPSSSPFHFRHTDMELALRACPIQYRVLPFGRFGHGNNDCNMEACVSRRLSEAQSLFGAFQDHRSHSVALNILPGRINRRRGRIRICK